MMAPLVQSLQSFDYPSPVGLCLGLLCVAVLQVVVIVYHYIHTFYCSPTPIQKVLPDRDFKRDVIGHFSRPEGFLLLGSYLTLTWMFRLLPDSYYSFEGGVNWFHVFCQLLLIDFFQTMMHLAEHKVSAAFYRKSHKPHHRYVYLLMYVDLC